MSCDKSQYCAYAHVSAMLARTGLPWWLAMFEIELYFDDSGTDGNTPVAVAACYVSTKKQWDEFVRNWDGGITTPVTPWSFSRCVAGIR